MRVLIVDDHQMFRQGIHALLADSEMEIVGEAENGREAVEKAKAYQPNVVVMDIGLPDMSGLDATSEIIKNCPDTGVVILSIHAEEYCVQKAIDCGACGYVYKGAAYEELILAIEAVRRGGMFISSGLSRPFSRQTKCSQRNQGLKSLTEREQEVIALLSKGMSRSEIAENLYISEKTVDRHTENIKNKLGIRQNQELVAHAQHLAGRAHPID